LHHQGVDRLGDGLRVEATADDRLVEAFRVGGAPGFNLAVQWHPEWKPLENPDSTAIFDAFGDAVRDYSSANKR
jgi:putative glutamine amidotransferase